MNQRPVSKGSSGSGFRRLFRAEVLADRVGPGADPAGLVVDVPLVDHRVELGQRVNNGHGDEVVAPEVADLALHSALLVSALDSRPAIERVDAPVRAELGPAFGFHPHPAQPDHPGDRRLQVVVADPAAGNASQGFQRVDVAFDEGLLAAGCEDPVDGLARIRKAEREQVAAGGDPGQHDVHVPEVDLGLCAGDV